MKTRLKDGRFKYFLYLLVYVDDCLLLDHDPTPVMEELKKRYELKGDLYGPPDRYLGANIDKYQLDDVNFYWSMHPNDYVTETSKMVKGWRITAGRLWTKRKVAMNKNYSPELDVA